MASIKFPVKIDFFTSIKDTGTRDTDKGTVWLAEIPQHTLLWLQKEGLWLSLTQCATLHIVVWSAGDRDILGIRHSLSDHMERVIYFLQEWEPYRADLARLAGYEGDEHQGHGGLQPELGVLSSVISTIVITISYLSSNIWDTVNNVNWNTVSKKTVQCSCWEEISE